MPRKRNDPWHDDDPPWEGGVDPDRLYDPVKPQPPPGEHPDEWAHRRGKLPEPPQPPGRRGRLDWGYAARALARGIPIEMVARDLGAPLDQVRRNLRRSEKFRRRIAAEEEMIARECAMRLRGLRHAVTHDLIQAFGVRDKRVLLHLAQALSLIGAGALPPGGTAATAAARAIGPWKPEGHGPEGRPAGALLADAAPGSATPRLSPRGRAAIRALRDEIRAQLAAPAEEAVVLQRLGPKKPAPERAGTGSQRGGTGLQRARTGAQPAATGQASPPRRDRPPPLPRPVLAEAPAAAATPPRRANDVASGLADWSPFR